MKTEAETDREREAPRTGADPLALLWTTRAEIVCTLVLRPNLSLWSVLQQCFLYDQDRPIPFVELLQYGPWTTLHAMWGPYYGAGAYDESRGARTAMVQDFLTVLAKAATLAVPVPYKSQDDPPGVWSSRWVRLEEVLGAEASAAIGRLWAAVETGNQPLNPGTWTETVAGALSEQSVARILRHLPTSGTALARAVVEAALHTDPHTVSELCLLFRSVGWRLALVEALADPVDLGPAGRLYDLSNPYSYPILEAIDQEYGNLMAGLLTFGAEYVARLDVKKE